MDVAYDAKDRTATVPAEPVRYGYEAQTPGRARYAWALARIAIGWVFLWAFLDKTFGLGFATAPEDAWILGGSPTYGFLTFGTEGPLATTFQGLAASAFVEALFMAGLLLLGVALLLGIAMHAAAYAGTLLLLLIYAATMPPLNNPIVDDHIVYALVLIGLAWARAGRTWGLGAWWSRLPVVRDHPLLQ